MGNTGTVTDPGGFAISSATNQQLLPAAVWNGTNVLAVWQDNRNAGVEDIYGTRGPARERRSIRRASRSPPSLPEHAEWVPSIAWNGTTFLVAWEDSRGATTDVWAARVDGSGNLLDPGGILLSTAPDGQYAPSVAWDGTNFLVVWEDFRSGSNYDIYGTRVSPAGSVLDPLGIPVSPAAGDQIRPAVSSNGTAFFVAWEDYRSGAIADIYGTRITGPRCPIPRASRSPRPRPTRRNPSVTSNGSDYLTVWTDSRTSPTDIYGQRSSSTGTLLGGNIAISTASGFQSAPAVAWNGSNYFVAWDDARSGAEDIYGSRVDGSGGVLDATGIQVSASPGSRTNRPSPRAEPCSWSHGGTADRPATTSMRRG